MLFIIGIPSEKLELGVGKSLPKTLISRLVCLHKEHSLDLQLNVFVKLRNPTTLCVTMPSAEEEEDVRSVHAVQYLHKRPRERSTAPLRHEKGTVLVPPGKLGRKLLSL